MYSRKAFTLVEVLVVVAIISLMAALLFPVFAHAHEKARQDTCASNLRQIGLAVIQYAQDNEGIFPFGGDPSDVYTNGWAGTPWAAKARTLPLLTKPISPYIKSSQLWHCPDDSGYDKAGAGETTPLAAHPSSFVVFGTSYGYNTYLAFYQQTLSGVTAWGDDPPYPEYGPDHIMLMDDIAGAWHGGTARVDRLYNVLFCDGHVRLTASADVDELWDEVYTKPTGS